MIKSMHEEGKAMKVLLISTSPRRDSRTEKLAMRTLDALKAKGVQTVVYRVRDKDHEPCKGCQACQKIGKCVIRDDMQDLHALMKEADGILIASPTYFYDVNSQCKMIIDRSYAVQPLNGNKVGGIVITAGSMGHSNAIKTVETFFTVQGIANVGFVSAFTDKEDLPKANQSAYDLGKKMFDAMMLLKDSENEPFAMHNHYSYGTHTI